MHKFKLHSINTGYCRIYYTTKNDTNERLIYCIQQDGHNEVNLYRCSKDGEPSHRVAFKLPLIELFPLFQDVYPVPKGNEKKLIELANNFIQGAQ
jgi:hypothetical protein